MDLFTGCLIPVWVDLKEQKYWLQHIVFYFAEDVRHGSRNKGMSRFKKSIRTHSVAICSWTILTGPAMRRIVLLPAFPKITLSTYLTFTWWRHVWTWLSLAIFGFAGLRTIFSSFLEKIKTQATGNLGSDPALFNSHIYVKSETFTMFWSNLNYS